MIKDDIYLGKCCLVFCDNEAHYVCDNCEDGFCKDHMKDNDMCYECP